MTKKMQPPLRIAGLFAGIGGIEVGLNRAGHESALLCEIEPHAQFILRRQFPDIPIIGDVREISSLGGVDLVAGGFPCQDLSQAGKTSGIDGAESGLVREMLRLVGVNRNVKWLLIENVSFMLSLARGQAMAFLTDRLEELGFNWAYRVVDTRAFGLPQRRKRVILLASPTEDPRRVLFADDVGVQEPVDDGEMACGFYWTEGVRGLGWAVSGIPTLKGGSSVGIPSAPAIWRRSDGMIGTPDVRDGERLQGFEVDWTAEAILQSKRGSRYRWKLVGNAVSVPIFEWVGKRLRRPGRFSESKSLVLERPKKKWPTAAWGIDGKRSMVNVSEWPLAEPYQDIEDFLTFELQPLSVKATAGFLKRFKGSNLRKPDGFVEALESHLVMMDSRPAIPVRQKDRTSKPSKAKAKQAVAGS